jgi:hypothetical protein
MMYLVLTKLWEDDDVSGSTLRTEDFSRAVPSLFLVHPPLKTALVDPFGGSPTLTRLDPFSLIVIFYSSKADPAALPVCEKDRGMKLLYTGCFCYKTWLYIEYGALA